MSKVAIKGNASGTGTLTIEAPETNDDVTVNLPSVSGPIFPVGFIGDFAGSTAPDGWLACDGSAVSRTTYSSLFAYIGTTWGVGDGSTTFNVPDLREVATAGAGTNSAGSFAASDPLTVGEYSDDQMQRITGKTDRDYVNFSGTDTGALKISNTSIRAAQGSTSRDVGAIEFDSALSPGARTGTTTHGKRAGVLKCIKV